MLKRDSNSALNFAQCNSGFSSHMVLNHNVIITSFSQQHHPHTIIIVKAKAMFIMY